MEGTASAPGQLRRRICPKRTLTIVLLQWVVVFIAAAATFHGPVFYGIGALAGVALGGTWTADRAFLARLAPPEKMGEFFGLYQLAGRFAAVIGPLVWGGTLLVLVALGWHDILDNRGYKRGCRCDERRIEAQGRALPWIESSSRIVQ